MVESAKAYAGVPIPKYAVIHILLKYTYLLDYTKCLIERLISQGISDMGKVQENINYCCETSLIPNSCLQLWSKSSYTCVQQTWVFFYFKSNLYFRNIQEL